ncbi:nuclear factor of activated T-cells, cytoplasmic 3-like [Thalassophryne amazonica]|uniref:nuclear factor of activated T-cells, cytoplasmic 3-like n=1 Tax=Thalassophryne amazonica TaxID=390379 RepID=UPI001471278B|nr:nuclear factor of activated T-cells, cytoplasmic 3-like [Thalassophryne amazonica]XP_034033015.1 nuclear factor of activated T-cells, cytoplasmic 3-like [Thalassophryne amazonica]
MSTEELDFRLVFEDDRRHSAGPDLDEKTRLSSTEAPAYQIVNQEQQSHNPCVPTPDLHIGSQSHGSQYSAQGNTKSFDCPSIQITSIAPYHLLELGNTQDVLAVSGAEGGLQYASLCRDQLYLPTDYCYRDPAFSPSPCSSVSSRSWLSDLSSCESFSHIYDDVEGELPEAAGHVTLGSPFGSPGCGGGAFGVELWQQKYQHPLPFSPALSPHQSPCHSPRTSITEENWLNRRPSSRPSSRPTSPCGKRRYSSADPRARSPSPQHSPNHTPGASPRGSVTEETWLGSPAGNSGSLLASGYQELDIPNKTRRTLGSHLGLLAGQGDSGLEEVTTVRPFLDSSGEEGQQQDGLTNLFLPVPSTFSWNKPKPGNPPLFRTSSPPPLDWPLPSRFDQLELKLEVQPKFYHRAHYETEGSRGAIKAASGGHPIVKLNGCSEQPLSLLLFIGTADDRYLRPHSFYQVHRVTGKTVTTPCQERIVGGTKVLEIPLLPGNDMSASIDCAGILKLRNADIELKKGETDIGRKNTRVRIVFRVGVPQPDSRMLWLQSVSVPVECSQRSGQDLPQVENFSPTSCSVDGGEEIVITGSNISALSRVVFMEKGPDGRSLWEVDAKVVPGKSRGSRIVVEVPPYNKKTKCPVQVQFYMSNGKKRRSLTQSFTYLPESRHHHLTAAGPQVVKQECWDPDIILDTSCGFSYLVSSQERTREPDVAFNSHHLPVHRGSPTQDIPHHPSSLQTFLMFPQLSSIPSESLLKTPQTSALPQTLSIHPHISTLQLQTFSVDPQASSEAHQSASASPLPFSGEPQREPSPSLVSKRTFLTTTDSEKDREVVNIKQEPDEHLNLGSLGLQEITLDDVNEIIDRDIGGVRATAQSSQYDQYHQYDWEQSGGP